MKHKKGNRVQWQQSDGMRYGVVFKGGASKIIVIVDGGETQVSGHATLFQPSTEPLPNADEVNPMSDYSISGYKEIEGHGDSPTFCADIRFKGKKVLRAMNDGWGGCNEYHGSRDASLAFEAAALKWAQAATGIEEQTSDVEDLWITWEVFERPYGKTAKESLQWLVDMKKGKVPHEV